MSPRVFRWLAVAVAVVGLALGYWRESAIADYARYGIDLRDPPPECLEPTAAEGPTAVPFVPRDTLAVGRDGVPHQRLRSSTRLRTCPWPSLVTDSRSRLVRMRGGLRLGLLSPVAFYGGFALVTVALGVLSIRGRRSGGS